MFPRQHQLEWMDAPGADRGELERSLKYIQRVNRWLGYTRATISHLDRFSKGWGGRTIHILDVATGSADIPVEICRWADRRNVDVRVTGIDLHPVTLDFARKEVSDDRITLLQADALSLPFADGSFDYAMTSMFLHHLSERQVVQVLKEMNRIARRGLIVADLIRDRRALAWISLFTLFSKPMVKHDSRVSVKQAFTQKEIQALARQAGLDYAAYYRHFGYRFVLAGEK